MASYPKVGDRVTVVGIEDGGLHRCVVVRRRQRNLLTRVPFDRKNTRWGTARKWVSPEEEGTVWARGWTTKAAVALEAHVALERSR